MPNPDQNWLDTCEEAARAGGDELRAWCGRFQAREKGVCDFVTDADLASQEAIRRIIAKRFPDHLFVGEEKPQALSEMAADQFVWIVDPLDGTTNYLHGYPQYAVSVALTRGNEILAGAIYDPTRDECFKAEAGRGAWCNDAPLAVSRVSNVGDALVAVSLPARVHSDSPDLADFIKAVQACQAVRRSGSAALNLAHVASGVLDAFWATHIHAWDVAAGILLIREAGGVVTGRGGQPFDFKAPHFLATSGAPLHSGMLSVLGPFPRDL